MCHIFHSFHLFHVSDTYQLKRIPPMQLVLTTHWLGEKWSEPHLTPASNY
jgi:hypothetical protein